MTVETPYKDTRVRDLLNAVPDPLRQRLADKLLAVAGTRVAFRGYDHYLDMIADRGRETTGPVRCRRGRPHECHANSARIWARAPGRYRIVPGFGLVAYDGGGVWAPHTWVLDGEEVIEATTPVRWDRYFGVVLGQDEALSFWLTQYLPVQYPRPMDLFDARAKARSASEASAAPAAP